RSERGQVRSGPCATPGRRESRGAYPYPGGMGYAGVADERVRRGIDMPQTTQFAPDVTCDHSIATIQKTVDTIEDDRSISGDLDSKSFSVEIAQGAVLAQLAEALAEAGYPLGE